jgi:peptidoglycan/LPS O-acetylase OafA/YrhL
MEKLEERMASAQPERYNNFNLLRLILALCVILSHSPELTDGDNHREPLMCLFDTIPLGFLAVDAFFLLSGYLIVQSWDLHPRARLFHFDAGILRLPSFFFSGGCFYHYRDRIRLDGRIALALAAALAVCMFSWSAAELALATMGCYVLIYMANKPSGWLGRFNRLPDVSYGTYLYAWPIQKLLIWYFPGISPWLVFAIAAPAAVALGAVSWFGIEKPALKFKQPARPVALPPVDRAAA